MTRHPADLGDERLAALLTAAAAPARPGELAGEDEAVRVYRSFRPTPPPPRARRLIARVAIVKTVVALAMLGGVALAAKSSRIPEPPEASQQTGTTAAGERDPAVDTPAPLVTEEPPTSAVVPPTTTAPPEGTPEAGLQWLCRLFLDDGPKARRDPGFPALIDEAGGRRHVGEFCRDLLGLPEEDDDRDEGNDGEGEGNGGEDATVPVPDPGKERKSPTPPAERPSVPLGAGAPGV